MEYNRHIGVKLQTLKIKKNIKVTQRNKHVVYKEITVRPIVVRLPTKIDPNIFMILLLWVWFETKSQTREQEMGKCDCM